MFGFQSPWNQNCGVEFNKKKMMLDLLSMGSQKLEFQAEYLSWMKMIVIGGWGLVTLKFVLMLTRQRWRMVCEMVTTGVVECMERIAGLLIEKW